MFHVNNSKQLIKIANDIGNGYHQFGEEDAVWRGDDGSFVIGDWSELSTDDGDSLPYVEAGTLGEYVTVSE